MKRLLWIPAALAATLAGAATRIVQDQCGPFTDVSPAICPYVLEMYYLGITAGTSPTTYSPDNPVTRGQAAVFVSKGVNQAIARSSRRAALGQWWTGVSSTAVTTTDVGAGAFDVVADGADLWTANLNDGTVSRVQASDGRLLETWTGGSNLNAIRVAMGRVFVVGGTNPGHLWMLDPTQPAGALESVADLGINPVGIAFDGSRLWIVNAGTGGGPDATISIVTPGTWSVATAEGFSGLGGIVFDGENMWVTYNLSLSKLDAAGAILQTIPLTIQGRRPTFDGSNIWLPTSSGGPVAEILVVKAATGAVLQTLHPPDNIDTTLFSAAFDGQRVLVTDQQEPRVLVWNAADLSFVGAFAIPSSAFGACSDGIDFWLALRDTSQLARF
jgi:hypothetical protein